jgi:hypothetical protein
MAVIYMTHPVHGAKVATMELEAEADEQNGWVRYNPDAPVVPVINELEVKRRRSRPVVTEGA